MAPGSFLKGPSVSDLEPKSEVAEKELERMKSGTQSG
jgi:hypothetical protein